MRRDPTEDPPPGGVGSSDLRGSTTVSAVGWVVASEPVGWRLSTTTWCPAAIGGIPVSRDNHHLTATYAQTLAPQLWAGLAPALGR